MPILIITIIALGIIFFVVSRSKKDNGGNWVQFFSKGKEAGFSFKEVELLRGFAVQGNLEYPHSLFDSKSQLDQCIRSIVRGIKMSGRTDDRDFSLFLSKLYDYRQKMEINKTHPADSILNSRQISEGQLLRIPVEGSGVYKSEVVKNTSQYMTISRPLNKKNSSSSMVWVNKKISVYFWREDDAGYVFDSEVLDEVFSVGVPSLKIAHGGSLFRTQKRKSIRTKIHKAAFLYMAPANEPPHKIETEPGLKCFLEDISDTGCAVTIGGKADSGMRVKVQFALDNAPVCMTGTVRSISFIEGANRSILHIEAEALPIEMRNLILGEVFGMLPDEDDEELPFRVLDDEMANFIADGDSADSSPRSSESAASNNAENGSP